MIVIVSHVESTTHFFVTGEFLKMKLYDCPVRATADVIDGKWKPLIINELKRRPLRFGRLLRALPDASRKVVTEQLRELEGEQIVARKALHSEPLAGVEYSLTTYGRTLVPVLNVMADWGSKHKRRRTSEASD
jgi:DNA-binding HxlR family transcriptional regulator